jgi:hypothetical protein
MATIMTVHITKSKRMAVAPHSWGPGIAIPAISIPGMLFIPDMSIPGIVVRV